MYAMKSVLLMWVKVELLFWQRKWRWGIGRGECIFYI